MNINKFIAETKEYFHGNLGTFARGDLHTLPQVHGEDLRNYLQSMHRFPRTRFARFVKKLKARHLIIESNERHLIFDPTFLF
jgi:hypothetical protein